ncbi:hypothetical protein MXB_1708 [Myxobolus squamalis]|nr:hypothetical protein MXB_1708 [Myxobolus squamalis]
MNPSNIHVSNYLSGQSMLTSCIPVTRSNFKFLKKSANILVVGAGGLGCEVIKNLVNFSP